ncbi:hypothetical protein [Bauldia sp.]|uniref:hypothetical protein n=1 Tax=Bauldia sp. TaxID=2575872 RepID=UPI003BAD2F4F
MKHVVAAALLLFAFSVFVAEAEDQPQTWEEASALWERLLDEGDCASAWDLAWSWAKAGSAQARTDLASAIALFGYNPPGDPGDRYSTLRHALILVVYTDFHDEKLNKEQYVSLLNYIVDEKIGDENEFSPTQIFRSCVFDKDNMKECQSYAINIGLVPEFEYYARQVDAISKISERDALCPNVK